MSSSCRLPDQMLVGPERMFRFPAQGCAQDEETAAFADHLRRQKKGDVYYPVMSAELKYRAGYSDG